MPINKIWHVPKYDHAMVAELSSQLAISRIMASVLINRKLTSVEEIKKFLTAGLEDLGDPFEVPGVIKGAARLYEAILRKEKIVIFGDYDVDGITATALLVGLLRQLGSEVGYYIPERQKDGYGLNKAAILRAKERGVTLAISVDSGIAAAEEALYAGTLGLELIITDHHQPPAVLPQALAIINPKLSAEGHPWSELAGVGVAYKLGQALAVLAGQAELADEYLDLVALGTVADIVPLQAENRILVNVGLRQMNQKIRPGLAALLEISGLTGQEISTQQISYAIAPRLNACGRISQADTGVELLLTNDWKAGLEMAEMVREENLTRQALEAKILDEALLLVETSVDLERDKVIVLAARGWHTGVIGIVASRLVDRYYRPTVIISIDEEGIGKGSARSIPGFDIYEAFGQVRENLLEYGGHAMAAGLSLCEDKTDSFRADLNAYAAICLDERSLTPALNLDAEISPAEIEENLVTELARLAPFGAQNPDPLLVLRRAQVLDCKQVGPAKRHLKMKIKLEKNTVDAIAFNLGALYEQLRECPACDLIFSPEHNSFNGREQLQLNIKDLKASDRPDDPFRGLTFLENLYVEGEVWLEDDCYRDVVDREEFFTKAVGVSFGNRQDTIRGMGDGEALRLVREPENGEDTFALALYYQDKCIGYLNTRLAAKLAPAIDKGASYEVYVTQITGRDKEIAGVNLCIRKVDSNKPIPEFELIRENLTLLPEAELTQEIQKAILGNYDYHEKQKEALDSLKSGHNSLVIFATGRGKSAIFQTMAAYLALTGRQVTVIVYPLRSLVNDQCRHMKEKMARLGLRVESVNGAASQEQKTDFFRNMLQGNLDIILTTPEFLAYHLDRFNSISDRLGLFVVDEAHHLGRARRKGYRTLPETWRRLGKPLSLAVTATANETFAARIIDALKCSRVIIEEHERSNLYLVDAREEKDKLAYLLRLVAANERTVIYVNSRKQAYQLAGELRSYYPPAREEIGFYHGGLNSEFRQTLEEMFRGRELRVMVTTSAFGEGIDIPDIKNVVLYHLCFSRSEFNQLAGRAGRDNRPAAVHILFGVEDKKLNEFILACAAPPREILAKLYIYLREQAQRKNPFRLTNQQISEAMRQKGLRNFTEQAVSAGLAVFEELGLILREVEGGNRDIHFVPPPVGKLELTDSVRYLEGLGEWEEFQEYAAYVLSEAKEEILKIVNQPICPLRL